ncbi:uncharacterized protein [Watersipora subatra]|uniref:uncharacterized protein isoform X2 n=1 Tax=Watersipora subatra TaxID=2589382 RepID=UPI00355BF169
MKSGATISSKRATSPVKVHDSGEPSTRPKVYSKMRGSVENPKDLPEKSSDITSTGSISKQTSEEAELTAGCSREDVEHTFTNLYCYSNLLQSTSDDNDVEHYRFLKFIKQIEHKQSELIRVSAAIPDCANLAIDLAYNFVVTSSYMSLMFSCDSGKQELVDEISQLALSTARHVLEFAHTSREELVPDCLESLLVVMQRFCLTTVVSQVDHLPNLTRYQMKVLAKVKEIIGQLDYDSEASLSTLDLNVSSDNSTLEEAVKEAQDFGKDVYRSAAKTPAEVNVNNNADTNSDSSTEGTNRDDEQVSKQPDSAEEVSSLDGKAADMDDIILFTKCNPYSDIWKLYIDNSDLVKLFKINKNLREACIDTLPDCFKIIRWLEKLAHDIVENVIADECEMVNRTFHTLQTIVTKQSQNETSNPLLVEIVQSFVDMGSRYDALIQKCEMDISKAIDEIKSDESLSSSSSSEIDSDEDGSKEAVR